MALWKIEDYKKYKKTHPNIYKRVSKHGFYYQAQRIVGGDMNNRPPRYWSNMQYSKGQAEDWVKKRDSKAKFI